jgi:hypothetical protein
VFQKRDRVSEARLRFRARRVSEERSCFRRSILFQNLDRVSESRSHFRIAIAFQNLDRILEFDRILEHVTFGKNDLASEAGPCFGRRFAILKTVRVFGAV